MDKIISDIRSVQGRVSSVDDPNDLLVLSEVASHILSECIEKMKVKKTVPRKKRQLSDEDEEEVEIEEDEEGGDMDIDQDDDEDEVVKHCVGPVWRTKTEMPRVSGRKPFLKCDGQHLTEFYAYPQKDKTKPIANWLCKKCHTAYANDVRTKRVTKEQVWDAVDAK